MAEYIKREDAIEEIAYNPVTMSVCLTVDEAKGRREERDIAIESIKRIPSADVVEVVRCKDCHFEEQASVNSKGFVICPASGMEITDDDYCSYGLNRRQRNERDSDAH